MQMMGECWIQQDQRGQGALRLGVTERRGWTERENSATGPQDGGETKQHSAPGALSSAINPLHGLISFCTVSFRTCVPGSAKQKPLSALLHLPLLEAGRTT
jgi:hypothetical protein